MKGSKRLSSPSGRCFPRPLTRSSYGPYVLVFPVISALPWPADSGTPGLACRLPLVATLTTLLIWNAPTMAAMLRSSQNNRPMGTNTAPPPVSSRALSRTSSVGPHQDVASLARTFLWVNESSQPWARSVCRQWSSGSGGIRSDSSITLSDATVPRWTGTVQRRYTDPTLVDCGPMPYAANRRHVAGFNVSHWDSIRSVSPVSMGS